MKSLITFFINKPLLVNLITVFILVAGYISLTNINRESYPHVDRKRLIISTIYPGASAEEVEINVTIPLEKALKGLEGIKEYSSTSVKNFSRIKVVLDDDVDEIEKIKSDIRREIDNVSLPEEITEKPKIWEWKVTSFAIIEIGVFSKTLSYSELRKRAKDLEKKIKEISYITKVNEKGIFDKEVKIKLNLQKLSDNYISIEEVINAIKSHNIEITGGVYTDNNRDTIITVFSKFKNIKDVKNIIIRSTFEGRKIYLRDIATIEDGFKKQQTKVRFNGEQGIALYPVKKANADIITTIDKIKEVVKEYKTTLSKEDVHFKYLWDISTETRTRLNIVQTNALIGFILVLIILFLFMNLKNAFWTAAGIPFSVAFAMILLSFFDITINSVSLLGIIVVMGMVVDDAIIISENIYRHKLMHKTWIKAAGDATSEVAFPVLTTILTTIVAFIPLYSLKGVVGEFAKEIPLVIIVVLIGSLIESLFILPNHISHSIKNKNVSMKEKKFITVLRNKYEIILSKFLNKSYIVIIIFIALFFMSYFALFSGKVLKYIDFPAEDSTAIYIHGKVKKGQNLDFSSIKIKIIENFLTNYSKKVIISYSCDIGGPGYPEKFFITVNLTDSTKRKIKADSIISNLSKKIQNSKMFTNIYFEKETGGPPVGRDINVKIVGNENDKRKDIANKIYNYLSDIKGVHDITRSDEENKREIKVLVDYDKAARLGVSPLAIGQTIRAAFNGVITTKMQTPDELIGYRLMLEKKYTKKLTTLYKLPVLNNRGRLIKLSQLITLKKQPLISTIKHYNGDRTTIIEASVDKKIITPNEIYKKFNNKFKNFEYNYPGFRLELGGKAKQSSETINSMINAALLAVSMIFFILILLFRSLTQSFLVLLAIPFSFIGIALALILHQMPLSMMALFGMVGLSGVVVNDSLVMVDYINNLKLKNKKKNIKELIVKGASTRLRPIILTTITTVAGLFPTAYGIGGRDMMIIPTTIVIAWGLFFSTALTLFLIPALYYSDIKIKQFFKNLIHLRKIFIIPFIGFLIISSNLFSKSNNILSLSNFINGAVKHNPKIFKELEKIDAAESLKIKAKAIYDIIANIHYYKLYDKPFSEYSSDKIDEQNINNFGIGVQGVIPYIGTRISAGFDYNKNNISFSPSYSMPFGATFDFYNPQINIKISQPLLKNWLGILDSFPIKQAKLNKFIMEKSVEESIETIVINLYNMYFDWYLTFQQYNIFLENVKNSEVLLKQIERKYKAGLSDKEDLSKIKIMTIEYKKARDLFKTELVSLTENIYIWFSGSNEIKSGLNIIPEEEIKLHKVNINIFNIENTRQMKILRLSKKLLSLTLKKEKNKLLPELNFNFDLKMENYTDDLKDSLSAFDYKNYKIGLSLSYPIGQHFNKGETDKVKIELNKWNYDIKNFKLEYSHGFYKLKKLYNTYKVIIEYDKKLIQEAKLQVKEEKKKYNQGRSDMYFIIQAKNSLLNYQLTYEKDYIRMKKIYLELMGMCDKIKNN